MGWNYEVRCLYQQNKQSVQILKSGAMLCRKLSNQISL